MSAWEATLDVSDVFHDDSLDLEEKAVKIRARLLPIAKRLDPGGDEAEFLADELVEAGIDGEVSEFDAVWNAIYDWADDARVWVKTR